MKVKHNPNIVLHVDETQELPDGTKNELHVHYEGPLFIDLVETDEGNIPSPVIVMLKELLCQSEE